MNGRGRLAPLGQPFPGLDKTSVSERRHVTSAGCMVDQAAALAELIALEVVLKVVFI